MRPAKRYVNGMVPTGPHCSLKKRIMPGILSGTHADVIMVIIINIAMNLLNGEANMRELMSPKNLAWPIMKTKAAAGENGDAGIPETGIDIRCEQSIAKSQGELS